VVAHPSSSGRSSKRYGASMPRSPETHTLQNLCAFAFKERPLRLCASAFKTKGPPQRTAGCRWRNHPHSTRYRVGPRGLNAEAQRRRGFPVVGGGASVFQRGVVSKRYGASMPRSPETHTLQNLCASAPLRSKERPLRLCAFAFKERPLRLCAFAFKERPLRLCAFAFKERPLRLCASAFKRKGRPNGRPFPTTNCQRPGRALSCRRAWSRSPCPG